MGEEVADAFLRMYFLERACDAQIASQAGGGALIPPPHGAAEKTAAIVQGGIAPVGRGLAWPALRRKLDRIDPSYAS